MGSSGVQASLSKQPPQTLCFTLNPKVPALPRTKVTNGCQFSCHVTLAELNAS